MTSWKIFKKAVGTVQIKGTKEIWQSNIKCDPGLDPGQGEKKVAKRILLDNWSNLNINAV